MKWLIMILLSAPSGYPGGHDIYPHHTFATKAGCEQHLKSPQYLRYVARQYSDKRSWVTGKEYYTGECVTPDMIEPPLKTCDAHGCK